MASLLVGTLTITKKKHYRWWRLSNGPQRRIGGLLSFNRVKTFSYKLSTLPKLPKLPRSLPDGGESSSQFDP